MLKQMPNYDIIQKYKAGERDFRNIQCVGTDFINLDLSGVDFSGSDLGFSSFSRSNLSNTNFSNCNLVWSDFERANMTNANFSKARFNWSVLNNAIFQNTNMQKADLSWCLLFGTNRGEVDLKDALIGTTAWHESEITSKGVTLAFENLQKLKSMIPYDLWLLIKASIEKNEAKFEKMKHTREHLSLYLDSIKRPYTAEDRHVMQEMGLGAYSRGGPEGYRMEPKYKGRHQYQK